MPRLSDAEVFAAVKDAGFPSTSWVTAVAVALAESGGNSDALNNANTNGSSDFGLFQINSVHSSLLNAGDWRDPVYNAHMALEISSNGTNWHPWVAYNTGRFGAYLPRAKVATRGAGKSVAGSAIPAPLTQNVGLDIGGVASFAQMLADPKTWLRLGMFLVGGVLILIALAQMTGVTNLAPAKILAKGLTK